MNGSHSKFVTQWIRVITSWIKGSHSKTPSFMRLWLWFIVSRTLNVTHSWGYEWVMNSWMNNDLTLIHCVTNFECDPDSLCHELWMWPIHAVMSESWPHSLTHVQHVSGSCCMSPSHVVCVLQLPHMCTMTHSHVGHDSFRRVTCLIILIIRLNESWPTWEWVMVHMWGSCNTPTTWHTRMMRMMRHVTRTKSFLEYWGCRTRQPGRTWLIGPGAVLVLI